MNRITTTCLAVLGLAAARSLRAQQPAAAPAPPAVQDSADVKTIDGLMRAVYDVISGDSAQARN